jgi:hypothetical protein
MPVSYDEHMTWCKQRALAYLPHDPKNAFYSIMSDVRKHPETNVPFIIGLVTAYMIGGDKNDPVAVREFIEGFN